MQDGELASHYDVVVVGGGMVGASFACALERSINGAANDTGRPNLSILVIETFPMSSDDMDFQPSFDARTTALSYGSSRIYQSFGLWHECNKIVTRIKDIHVSDRGRLGSVKLSSQQQALEALGYVIENRALGRILNKAMQSSTGIELLCPASVISIKPQAGGMDLTVKLAGMQRELKADLVVLADGGKSPICRQLGIENTVEHYQQHALISNIAFSNPHNNVAYERFTDSGPLAVLPLAKLDGANRGALIWTVREEQSKTLLENDETQLIALLQEAFGYRLGKINRIGERFCYPLSLTVAREQIRPGLVLLGNVAHTLHPVAGQGLNLALRDIDVLVQVLSEAYNRSLSLGSIRVLQSYLDQQSKDQNRTINFYPLYDSPVFIKPCSACLGQKIRFVFH